MKKIIRVTESELVKMIGKVIKTIEHRLYWIKIS